MASIIKGSLSEDGILSEGGSFANKPAPFEATLPSDMLSACAAAIKYYRIAEDERQENKWTAIAEGLFRTTTGLYKLPAGYPYDPVLNSAPIEGDVGSVQLKGYVDLLGQMTGAFSSKELRAITGDITSRL
jgi:hypothetical protein